MKCEWCEKEFEPATAKFKYCCEACKIKANTDKARQRKNEQRRLAGKPCKGDLVSIKCRECGKEMTYTFMNREIFYCSTKCSNAYRYRIYKNGLKVKTFKRLKNKNDLAQINEQARQSNMTYGQYIASQYLKRGE